MQNAPQISHLSLIHQAHKDCLHCVCMFELWLHWKQFEFDVGLRIKVVSACSQGVKYCCQDAVVRVCV